MGGPGSSLGMPSSTGLGLYVLSSVKSRARGMVFVSTVQMKHAARAWELIQSMVAPSCSAAKVRSPPSLTAPVVDVAPELLLLLLLPHAAATSDRVTKADASSCNFFTSRKVS